MTIAPDLTANEALRAVRLSLRMSQDDMARALRKAGVEAGEPNDANKRLVQRWEGGTTRVPRPVYVRALEKVTGLPIESLGFALPVMIRLRDDGAGGHDLAPGADGVAPASADAETAARTAGRAHYAGVWLSRYEFYSSGRGQTFAGAHYVVLVQNDNRLTGQSLPGASSRPDSALSLDLTVDGNVITGTWVEQTATDGYYAGARYHGAVQLLAEPTGRRMAGKWVGFGKDFDVNTGPWELIFKEASTSKETVERYSRRPE
ncbi:DNA-binding protein [Streptomyces sp. CB02923]|uniref:helix-turn-helix domain-containing protein n=1 Tax=Streptomyces sp. CB02923 TaxID=1718985 RepID=UPI00093B65C6|nr:helix-turn-helix transcriptional regulator [Streptomyces sp. CB02923]OKI09618.1 DNA-binding protein [Streptomyces sp. CB02923]